MPDLLDFSTLSLTLLHTLWIGALVPLLVWATLAVLPARRAGLRHAVATGGVFAVVGLAAATHGALAADAANRPDAAPLTWPAPDAVEAVGSADRGPEAGVSTTVRGAVESPAAPSGGGLPWRPILCGAWAVGVAVSLSRTVGGVRRARGLHRSAGPAPAWLQERADRLRRRLGSARGVAVKLLDVHAQPVCVGLLHPVVLLPASMVAGDPGALRFVLAHELAHARGLHPLVAVATEVAASLLFFHPGVRWLAAQAALERETVADAAAARACGDDPEAAAAALGRAAEGRARWASPVPAAVVALCTPGVGGRGRRARPDAPAAGSGGGTRGAGAAWGVAGAARRGRRARGGPPRGRGGGGGAALAGGVRRAGGGGDGRGSDALPERRSPDRRDPRNASSRDRRSAQRPSADPLERPQRIRQLRHLARFAGRSRGPGRLRSGRTQSRAPPWSRSAGPDSHRPRSGRSCWSPVGRSMTSGWSWRKASRARWWWSTRTGTPCPGSKRSSGHGWAWTTSVCRRRTTSADGRIHLPHTASDAGLSVTLSAAGFQTAAGRVGADPRARGADRAARRRAQRRPSGGCRNRRADRQRGRPRGHAASAFPTAGIPAAWDAPPDPAGRGDRRRRPLHARRTGAGPRRLPLGGPARPSSAGRPRSGGGA